VSLAGHFFTDLYHTVSCFAVQWK